LISSFGRVSCNLENELAFVVSQNAVDAFRKRAGAKQNFSRRSFTGSCQQLLELLHSRSAVINDLVEGDQANRVGYQSHVAYVNLVAGCERPGTGSRSTAHGHDQDISPEPCRSACVQQIFGFRRFNSEVLEPRPDDQ
jgi:hypothetical protein